MITLTRKNTWMTTKMNNMSLVLMNYDLLYNMFKIKREFMHFNEHIHQNLNIIEIVRDIKIKRVTKKELESKKKIVLQELFMCLC
jgi:hypothetical protein